MPLSPSRVRAICFDLDGTLADTDDQAVQRMADWLRPLASLFPDNDPAGPLRRALMASETPLNFFFSLPDRLGLDSALAWAMDALHRWRGVGRPGHFLLIPGVPAMLDGLAARYPLALVTARDRRGTEAFLSQFELGRYFRCVVSAHTCARTKPHPMPVLWAAAQMGVPPDRTLMVGDTSVDILSGRRAGAQTVGVLCGFGRRAELERCGADAIVERTPDVVAALQEGET